MVIVANVVASVVTLNVLDERLEVEVWKFVHHVEHNVLKELIVELGRAGHDLNVATVLGKASVCNDVVLVVGINDHALQPLVVSVADEALSILEFIWAVHLTVAAEVRAESLLLTDGVLHERTTVIHLAVNCLTAHPLVCSEGCFIDVHDLVPGAHEVLLLELFLEMVDVIADDILNADMAAVD